MSTEDKIVLLIIILICVIAIIINYIYERILKKYNLLQGEEKEDE